MNSHQAALLTKLINLKNCVERIENKKPFTIQQLTSDFDLQDVVSLNMQRAIQICVDIAALIIAESNNRPPETMSSSFIILNSLGALPKEIEHALVKAVGMRNILVHEYTEINWTTVYRVTTEHMNVFKDFMTAILKYAKIDLDKVN